MFLRIAIVLSVLITFHSRASDSETTVKVDIIAEGLGIPWGITPLSEQALLITQKDGRFLLLDLATNNVTEAYRHPSVSDRGQGGLLDVVTAPDFSKSGKIYYTYSKKIGNASATTLATAIVSETKLVEHKDIFTSNVVSNGRRHFGSRIAFDQQGHVFVTHGDRGDRETAQDRTNHSGTVLRLNLDGSIPDDNPFVSEPPFAPEIWSFGHRNPQGIAFDAINNRLWVSEHGPRGGDEINLVQRAKNYGWPTISYGKEYISFRQVGEGTHKKGMEQPHKTYIPSIAPGSLMLYSGRLFENWQGDLFLGALKLTHLNRVSVDKNLQLNEEERLFSDRNLRIRSLAEDWLGHIYFGTDDGKIFKLSKP